MRSSNTNLISCNAEAGGRKYFFFQYFLLFAILIFCIYQYGIHRIYGFCIYPDEFGYWTGAAQWIGYDWSKAASLGYYYSFGYSFILTPILRLCHDSISAYRVAVTINMVLQCASIGLLWGIVRRLFLLSEKKVEEQTFGMESEKKMRAVFAVGVAVFYPAWTFYMQMTLAESLLSFLYVLICYQFVLLFEKPNMISAMLLSLSFLYIYFVHMRTIGVVLAGILFLFLLIWYRTGNKKILLTAAGLLFIGAAVGAWLKEILIDTAYSSAEASHLTANDYAGRLAVLQGIFSGERLRLFFISCVGKFYYLGMASFGLLYPALFFCIRRSVRFWKRLFTERIVKDKKRSQEVFADKDGFYFFLLFSMLGQFLISAIGASGGGGRQDGLIYGRYNDYFLPVFMGVGVICLFESRHLIRDFLLYTGISTVLFAITFSVAMRNDSTVMYGCFATGLNYLTKDIYTYQVSTEYPKAFIFGIFLMAFVMVCIGAGRYGGRIKFSVWGVILLEILLTICLSKKYTWYFNDIDYYDLRICEYIEEYENGEKEPIAYLYGGGNQYIDLIQFVMPDRSIDIYKELDDAGIKRSWDEIETSLPQEGFLLADRESGYLGYLEKKYERCMEGSSFVLFKIK